MDYPSWEFVWNRWLSSSLRKHGLGSHCPALLQGMCEQRTAGDFDGKLFSYVLVARRCRLHVGPRYLARGLNEAADPGNEIECEQVGGWDSIFPYESVVCSLLCVLLPCVRRLVSV